MSYSVFTEYRIVFEGCGAEAVTSPLMERVTTDGVARIEGLIRDGIAIEEEVDIGRAEVEGAGMSISIVDRQYDDAWTTHFSRYPSTQTWLTTDIDATTTPETIDVDSTAGFAVDDYIHIGTECMLVTAVLDSTSMTVARARRGTILQAHYTDEGANLTRPVVAHTYPFGLQGRRARVYEYTLGQDDMQGDGQLIWRGIIATEAELSDTGCEWSMTIESLYWLLKQDIGGDTEVAFSLRGYFYSAIHPLVIAVYEYEDGTRTSDGEEMSISGHFETVVDLVAEINAEMPAAMSTLSDSFVSGSLSAITFEDGSWGFTLETDSTETKVARFFVYEANWRPVDNYTRTDLSYGPLGTNQVHVLPFVTPMLAPRGVWGPHSGPLQVPLTGLNNPHNIYPDGLALLNEDDTLVLESSDGETFSYRVAYELDVSRLYQIDGPVRARPWFTPETAPRFTRHTTYVSRGTLADFRDALVAAGPVDANRGAAPFLTTEDLASWDVAVNRGAANVGPLAQRRYIVAQATELAEMLSHECRLLGVFPRLDSDGKIGMAYLEMPTASTPSDFVLDDDTIIIDESPPKWQPNVYGTLNTGRLLVGYDPVEDEHTGVPYDVRDVTSLSIRKNSQQLLIEPKSMDAADFGPDHVVAAFSRVLGIYSRPYAIIPVQVPHTLRDVALVGTVCTLTNHRLPNILTGRRGIEGVKALVIRRAWNAATGRVDIAVIASAQRLLGYAPTVSITATSGSGTNRTFTVSTNDPDSVAAMAPSALDVRDMFPVGTRVDLMEWDTLTQTPQPGTVKSVSPTTVEVEFDASASVTGTRYLRYADAGNVDLASQRLWAYMATTASVVEFFTGDESASVFSA